MTRMRWCEARDRTEFAPFRKRLGQISRAPAGPAGLITIKREKIEKLATGGPLRFRPFGSLAARGSAIARAAFDRNFSLSAARSIKRTLRGPLAQARDIGTDVTEKWR